MARKRVRFVNRCLALAALTALLSGQAFALADVEMPEVPQIEMPSQPLAPDAGDDLDEAEPGAQDLSSGEATAPIAPLAPEVELPSDSGIETALEARAAPTLEPQATPPVLLHTEYAGALPVSHERLMEIPLVLQADYKEKVARAGGKKKSVASSGCGAVCLSMAVRYLTGNDRQTPTEIFEWAYLNNYYNGNGLTHEGMTKIAAEYGVSGKWIAPDRETVLRELRAGYPVIAHVGKSVFTKKGHYILLRGAESDDMVYVNDPASAERSGQTFSLDMILEKTRGSSGIMTCRAR